MEVLALEELEEMSTAAGWEVEYRQLEPGMIRTSVTGAELGSASLIREFSNRRVEVNGAPPEEMVVVLAPNGGTRLRVNGQMIRRDEVFVLAPGSELHAASLPDADVVSLHLPVRLLAEALEVLNDREKVNFLSESL